jgi:hypothetical protein
MQESTCGCCSCTSSDRSVVARQPNTSFQDDVRISSIASPWLGMLSTGLRFDIDGLFFCFFIFSLFLDFHVKLSNFSKKHFNLFSLRILFFFFLFFLSFSWFILYFNSIPCCFISFNFYTKFGPHSFDVIYFMDDWEFCFVIFLSLSSIG